MVPGVVQPVITMELELCREGGEEKLPYKILYITLLLVH